MRDRRRNKDFAAYVGSEQVEGGTLSLAARAEDDQGEALP